MLESTIKDKTMVHFDTNHLFYEQKHGFCPTMSCITQLLHAMDHWTKSFDDGNDVNIVYLDFCLCNSEQWQRKVVNSGG